MANQAPPAPPPYQPMTPSNNPYEFITNPGQPQKKGLFGGGSKKQRLLLVGALAAILLTVGMVVVAVLSSSGGGLKEDYISLVQQQAEIIRVSQIGEQKARDTVARNLAVTTKLSVSSAQSSINPLAKKAGAPTDSKSLTLGKNTDTDKKLTEAEQINQFDETFIETINGLLKKYQQQLKKLYDQSTNTETKKVLQQAYNSARLLTATESE